jgi:hypothetical protein
MWTVCGGNFCAALFFCWKYLIWNTSNMINSAHNTCSHTKQQDHEQSCNGCIFVYNGHAAEILCKIRHGL